MLKKRIIPIELFYEGRLYKTKRFSEPRDVGCPIKSSTVYSDQDADELILVNIDRDKKFSDTFVSAVEKIAENCYVPLSVGGCITEFVDVERLFAAGADKVIINSAPYRDTDLISQISQSFGAQAVIISIDVKRASTGYYSLYSECAVRLENVGLAEHLQRVLQLGVGEIMIQAIDRDGVMGGYDLDLLAETVRLSSVPVILAGGAGSFIDLLKAFLAGADAVACGSLFNFGDNNPLRAKAFLNNYEVKLKRV